MQSREGLGFTISSHLPSIEVTRNIWPNPLRSPGTFIEESRNHLIERCLRGKVFRLTEQICLAVIEDVALDSHPRLRSVEKCGQSKKMLMACGCPVITH